MKLRNWMSFAVCLSGLVAGCSGGKSQPAESADHDRAMAGAGSDAASPRAHDAAIAPIDEGGPTGAIQAALNHVQSGNLHLAYDFLPATYHSDIDRLVHDLAARMDDEVWDQLFAVLRKGATVLRQKRGLIDAAMRSNQETKPEEASGQVADWDVLADALELLIDSELSDLKRLRQVSSREFLESTGNRLFQKLNQAGAVEGNSPLRPLRDVRVELLSGSANEARVRIISPNSPDAAETEMVKLEGKWIPRSLSEGWSDSMQQAEESVKQLTSETMAGHKEEIQLKLAMVEQVFDQMLQAETAEQLVLTAIPLGGVRSRLQELILQSRGPQGGVTIIATGNFDDDTQTRLLQALEQLTDNPQRSTYSASASSDKFTIVLKPVADPVAFAERLTFANSKTVDVTTRTIRIELSGE